MSIADFVKDQALDFLEVKDFFQKIDFEVIGRRRINNEELYFIKKKRINYSNLRV